MKKQLLTALATAALLSLAAPAHAAESASFIGSGTSQFFGFEIDYAATLTGSVVSSFSGLAGYDITSVTIDGLAFPDLLPAVGGSGGGFPRTDITELDDVRTKEIPILAEATSLTFSYHWDSALAWLSTVEAASRAGSVTPFRITIGTTKIYGAGYWGYNSVPSIQNGVLVSSIELSLVSDVTTYTT